MNKSLKKLVLLPGMDGSGELFRGLEAVLPEGLETETLWYPADRYMNYGELAGTLRGAIPVDEPFVLVAESYGAPLAVLIASLEPPNLKGIVLSAGFATSPMRGLAEDAAVGPGAAAVACDAAGAGGAVHDGGAGGSAGAGGAGDGNAVVADAEGVELAGAGDAEYWRRGRSWRW